MNRQVMCDRCGKNFVVEKSCCCAIESGDLSVQYFSCPFCGTKYQILTTDTKMRELIEKRKVAQMKLKAAFVNKFRKKTIEEYERELAKLKAEQEHLLPDLKKRGEDILRGEAANG